MRSRTRQDFAVLAAAIGLASVACKPTPDQGGLQILTVNDPFVGPPPATQITVAAVGADAGSTILAQGAASQGSIDLGTREETDTESLLVTATDGAGTRVAWGETLPVELGALAGLTLGVFVQRTGTLSRMPSPLTDARHAPLVGVLGGRYVFVAGGTDAAFQAQTQLYDLIAWAPLGAPPVLPLAPQSVAFAQLEALVIGPTQAQWYDLSSSTGASATAPATSPTWADVAGGATITSTDDSTSYVVGATRTSGAPTSAVLVVASTGALSWASLTTPRLGAAVAWVNGLGVVIAGGNGATASDAGAAAAGVELLAAGSTTAIALAYPSDATAGAGMAALDGSHVLIVGGTGANGTAARVLTVPCSASAACTSTTWQATLPTPLPLVQVFDIDASSAFVVGEDSAGAMHAYRLTPTTVAEVPFRVPRSHARAVRLPIGSPGAGPIAVVGGDPSIESFTP